MRNLLLIIIVSLLPGVAAGDFKPTKKSRTKASTSFAKHCEQVMASSKRNAAEAFRGLSQADKWQEVDQKSIEFVTDSDPDQSLVQVLEEESQWQRSSSRSLITPYWVAAKPYYQAQALYNVASACAAGDYSSKSRLQDQLQLIEQDLDLAFGRSTNRCNDGGGANPTATAPGYGCADDAPEAGVADDDNSTDMAGTILERKHQIRQELKNLTDAKNNGVEINMQALEAEINRLEAEWMELSADNRDLIHTKGILVWEKKIVEKALADNSFEGTEIPRK